MNTCRLPSCSIPAWSVSERVGKASRAEDDLSVVGSVTGMGMVCVLPLSGREERHFLFRQSCGDLNPGRGDVWPLSGTSQFVGG